MGDEELLMRTAEALQPVPVAALSANQHAFMLIWDLEAEINNGGFSQYFQNSTGRDAERCGEALVAIGAEKCANLIGRALEVVNFTTIDWLDDAKRREHIDNSDENVGSALDELDAEFFKYPDNLTDLLTDFVASHPHDFST